MEPHVAKPEPFAPPRRVAESFAPPDARGSDRIDTLTGLRGFAILLVFVSHCANAGLLPAVLGKGAGQLGVMLFFVLSGFLMASLYARRTPGGRATVRFLAARLGRVAPLFFLVVAASFLVGAAMPGWPYAVPDAPALLRHLAFVQGDAELWAVPVEVQFYLAFLALWGLAHGAGRFDARRYLILGAAMLAGCLAVAILAHIRAIPIAGVLRHAPYFLIGALLAVAGDRVGRWLGHARSTFGDGLLSVLALGALAACFPGVRAALGAGAPMWLDPTVAAAVTATFVLALHGVGAFGLLRAAPMLHLGAVSYGLYLIHPIVIGLWLQHRAEGGAAAAALILGLSVLAAAASLVLIERPALRWIRSLAERRSACRAPRPGRPRGSAGSRAD